MAGFKSFLHVRDPSIIAWNQPRINPATRTNLLSKFPNEESFGSEESSSSNNMTSEIEYLEVFLRIKPANDISELYEINNEVLTCHVPLGSQHVKNLHDGQKLKKQYSFTKIFGPKVDQSQLFTNCIKCRILKFINGKNSTIFTYGTSGSGKTYTILGTAENPGIIPRSLEYIFRTIPSIKKLPNVKPTQSGELIFLDSTRSKQEIQLRNTILNSSSLIDKNEHVETYRLMQKRLSTEPTGILANEKNPNIGLWVSFAEIYNEYVYDLLVPEAKRGKQRTKLRLGQDSKGNTYVKDLTNISVTSGLEAYEILQYGMHSLSYAATSVNAHSSRSHCVFTIKLVQFLSKSEVQISHFNFCDLAGSERVKNTQNVGERLRESNNINTSLHVLGRCIELIRKNQKLNESRIVPFRDSKLTRLFQQALSGHESIAMVVNINATREQFDESQHVLNFSAIARNISIEKEKPVIIKKRFSQYIHSQSSNLDNINVTEMSECENLRNHIQILTFELENREKTETDHRRNLVEAITKKYDEMAEKRAILHEKEMQEIIDGYEQKLELVQKYYIEKLENKENKRPRNSTIILDDTIDEEMDYVRLNAEHKIILEQLKVLKETNSSLQAEITKLKFDLTIITNEKDIQQKKYEEMQKELINRNELISCAKVEVLELENEKNRLEQELEKQIIEKITLSKKIADLNDQLQVQIASQNEQVEQVESLEEKLSALV